MDFRKILDEDFVNINNVIKDTQYNGCEYSKIYLKSWPFFSYNDIEIAYENDIIYLRFYPAEKYIKNNEKNRYYFCPVTQKNRIVEGIKNIEAQCNCDGEKMIVVNMPQEYVDLLDLDNYFLYDDINYQEYLYSVDDLTNLKGKKYHAKRNHIQKFDKLYSYNFRPYTSDDYDNVMKLSFDWYSAKNTDFEDDAKLEEEDETHALKTELKMVCEEKNAFADVLCINEEIVGFTLGEISASNVGIVHVEKCDINYDGIYPKINNLFVKKHFQNVRIINRQEDLGIEGLRKSKQSYYPIAFCKKYFLQNFPRA